jgi:hypothetical protein
MVIGGLSSDKIPNSISRIIMPLTSVQIRPGLNKTETPTGSEGQWIDSDFIRFRYGQPEKIGGYVAIGQETMAGPARAIHSWTDLEGRKYAA